MTAGRALICLEGTQRFEVRLPRALHVSKVLVGVHPRAATSDPAEGDLGVDVQEQHHVWDPDAIEPEHPSGAADGPGGRHRWQPARALFGKGFALDQKGEHRAQVIDRRAGARCTPMGRASPVVAGTAHRGEDQVAVAHDHVAPVPAADRDRSVVLEHEMGELQVGVSGAIAKALGEAPKNVSQSRCQREPLGVKARRKVILLCAEHQELVAGSACHQVQLRREDHRQGARECALPAAIDAEYSHPQRHAASR